MARTCCINDLKEVKFVYIIKSLTNSICEKIIDYFTVFVNVFAQKVYDISRIKPKVSFECHFDHITNKADKEKIFTSKNGGHTQES